MPTLLVSGAGLGDSSVYGTTLAANKAGSIRPAGALDERLGLPRTSPDARGRNVTFDFTVVKNQSGASVRLDFDLNRPFSPRGADSQTFGTASVVNKAQGATTKGWVDTKFGVLRTTFPAPARALDFNFTASFFQSGKNVGFYFGGGPVVTHVSAGDQSSFGSASVVNKAFAIYPIGVRPLDPFQSVLFVGRAGGLNFNFVAAYTPPPGNSVRLDFDVRRPIEVPGLNATQFGSATLRNKAFGIFPTSIAQAQFGHSLVSFPARGRSLDFNFTEPYTPDTGRNIAFAFGESKRLVPPGWDSLVFSAPHVAIPAVIKPAGINSLLFGTAKVGQTAVAGHGWDSLVFGSATQVGFIQLAARPFGILGLQFGAHLVAQRIRTLSLVGFNAATYGRLTIANKQQTLQTLGFSDEAMGQPSLRLTRQYIGAVGSDSLTLAPAARSQDWMTVHSSIGPTQEIRPFDFGDDVSVVSEPYVAFYLQYIRLPIDGPESTQWGDASVIFKIRRVYVPWSVFTQWGRPQFGWTPKIEPPGIDSAAYGTPDLALGNIRHIQGFDTLEVSTPLARLMRLPIVVGEWDEKDKSGTPLVYNRTQILYVDNKQYFDYAGPVSEYVDVRNVNRHVAPDSWVSSHFPNTHRARLTGQQVLPLGIDSPEWGGHLVAYRIRHVYPDTRYFFAGFVDPYHFVHNQATRIYPVGIDSLKIPALHLVWFNAQHIAPRYIQADGVYGRPFVAWNPRYLQQFDAELGSVFGTAWVSNFTRHVVEAPWQVPYGFGTPILYTHRNLITVFPIAFNLYGTPRVHNVTPQLYPSMAPPTEYGVPWVSHAPRTLLPDVVLTTTFADPLVLFRNRTIYVPGIEQTAIPMPTVRQEIEELRFDQTIWPQGIPPPGVPTQSVSVYPQPQGWDSLTFGSALNVRLQGCSPYTGIPDSFFGFGIPTINKAPQVITEINRDDEQGSQTGWAKPAASPFTIWAQTNPPEQAQQNHPGPLFYELGALDNPPIYDLPPWFGTARVWGPGTQYIECHHRGDGYGNDYTRGEVFGNETHIDNTKHYIDLDGWDSKRFGFPTLPHSIKVWNFGWFDEEFGTPTVGIRPFSTQYIRLTGFSTLSLSPQQVDNWVRNVYPSGSDNTIYGDNQPMVYHKPRGPNPVGDLDFTEFGEDTWVSYKNRELPLDGFESYEEGYTSGQFNDRMMVTRGQEHRVVSVGEALRMGVPDVSLGAGSPQVIGPYMIPPPVLCHPHAIELEEV